MLVSYLMLQNPREYSQVPIKSYIDLLALCVFYAHVNSYSHHILYRLEGEIIEICHGPNKPPPIWKFYNLSRRCKGKNILRCSEC